MTTEELVKKLKINKVGTYSQDNAYIIDLDSSEDFGKVYSTLDSNEELDYSDDQSLLTVHNSSLVYLYNEEFQINLIADFDNDAYKIVIKEL